VSWSLTTSLRLVVPMGHLDSRHGASTFHATSCRRRRRCQPLHGAAAILERSWQDQGP
jgi:hypothetical protein